MRENKSAFQNESFNMCSIFFLQRESERRGVGREARRERVEGVLTSKLLKEFKNEIA